MRSWLRNILLTLLALGCVGLGRSAAQDVIVRPMTLNETRAYHHFLTSPSSYKTWTSLRAGYSTVSGDPWIYVARWVEPSYTRRMITPRGYEEQGYVPSTGAVQETPFSSFRSVAPGYPYKYTSPTPPPTPEVVPPPLAPTVPVPTPPAVVPTPPAVAPPPPAPPAVVLPTRVPR